MLFAFAIHIMPDGCVTDTGGDKGRPCGSLAVAMTVALHIGRLRNTWVRVHGEFTMTASPVMAIDTVWVAGDACKKRWFWFPVDVVMGVALATTRVAPAGHWPWP